MHTRMLQLRPWLGSCEGSGTGTATGCGRSACMQVCRLGAYLLQNKHIRWYNIMAVSSHDDHEMLDGEVIDDLAGEQQAPPSEDDEGDEGHDVSGEEEVPVEDDSLHSFEGHSAEVVAVAWSPAHPDLVASGGMDDKAYIWRVGQEAFENTAGTLGTFELAGHTDTVASVAFSSQGTLLATGGMDGFVKVWDTSNGQLVQTLDGPGGAIEWVCWHPKGNVVLAGSDDMTVWMWLAQTGQCMQVFSGHSGPVTAGEFSRDGKAVITVGGPDDNTLRVWSPKTGECTTHISGHPFHETGITCLAVHQDSVLTLTGDEDGHVCICNTSLSGQHRVLANISWHEESVEAVGWSPHSTLVASAGVDGFLRIWDCNNSSIQRSKCEHPGPITRLAWHPTQPLVFTACADAVTRCWDLRTGTMVRQYGGHLNAVQDITLSPDGSMLLSGSDDGTAKVFLVNPAD